MSMVIKGLKTFFSLLYNIKLSAKRQTVLYTLFTFELQISRFAISH